MMAIKTETDTEQETLLLLPANKEKKRRTSGRVGFCLFYYKWTMLRGWIFVFPRCYDSSESSYYVEWQSMAAQIIFFSLRHWCGWKWRRKCIERHLLRNVFMNERHKYDFVLPTSDFTTNFRRRGRQSSVLRLNSMSTLFRCSLQNKLGSCAQLRSFHEEHKLNDCSTSTPIAIVRTSVPLPVRQSSANTNIFYNIYVASRPSHGHRKCSRTNFNDSLITISIIMKSIRSDCDGRCIVYTAMSDVARLVTVRIIHRELSFSVPFHRFFTVSMRRRLQWIPLIRLR